MNEPAKTIRRAFWLMLMKAARAGESRPEATDVDVAVGVDLGHPETRHVEPAAVIEIELLALPDDGVGASLRRRSRDHAARRRHAWLGGQRHVLENALLVRDRRDALRHADAEIDDAAHRQLERAAARDDPALVVCQRFSESSGTRNSPENAGL